MYSAWTFNLPHNLRVTPSRFESYIWNKTNFCQKLQIIHLWITGQSKCYLLLTCVSLANLVIQSCAYFIYIYLDIFFNLN